MSFKVKSPLKPLHETHRRLKNLKIETKFIVSETKSSISSSKVSNNIIMKNNTTINGNKRKKGRINSLKPMIDALIDYNLLQNQSELQNKVDYFITPYNTCLDFKKSMQFEDKRSSCTNLDDIANKDWKLISNFILNTEKKDFRSCLGVANKELYLKVKELACTIASKKTGNRNISHQSSICGIKSLRRQSTLSKRQMFQSQIQESFNNIRRMSSKNLPSLVDSFALRQDSDVFSHENSNENSELLTTKIDLRQLNQQNEEVGSIISPLLGMMREKECLQQQRLQKDDYEKEFTIDLKEMNHHNKKHSNDVKINSNRDNARPHYLSKHNRSGRLSRVEERSVSNSSNHDINTEDHFGFMNLFSSSKILDHIQPILISHHRSEVSLPKIIHKRNLSCIENMKCKKPQSSKSIALNSDKEATSLLKCCSIPMIPLNHKLSDNFTSSIHSSASTCLNSEQDSSIKQKAKETSLYLKRNCDSLLSALDSIRAPQPNHIPLPNLNHLNSWMISPKDPVQYDSCEYEAFKKPEKEKEINKNMIVYLHNSNPVRLNKRAMGHEVRKNRNTTASMLKQFV